MEVDKGRLLHQSCRTCLSNDFLQLEDLFSKTYNNMSIAELLLANAAIEVDETDKDLPRLICRDCYECLIKFHKFRKRALDIDAKLNNLKYSGLNDHNLMNLCPLKVENEIITCDSDITLWSDDKQHIKDIFHSDCGSSNQDDNDSYIFQSKKESTFNLLETDKSEQYKQNKTVTCNICNKVLSKKSKLKPHIKECHKIQPGNHKDNEEILGKPEVETQIHNCKYCETSFRNVKALSAHMRKHVSMRNLSCPKCLKIFKKTSHLKRHEIVHEHKFKCRYCTKIFLEENEYKTHLLQHSETKSMCPICCKKFRSNINLNAHMRVHLKEPKYLCQSCGRSFYSKGNLMQHVKRHFGQKEFCCQFCPHKFVSKGELKFHMVVHTKEKRYACIECGAKFTRHTSLSQHRKNHKHIKPFKCDTCLLSFATKDYLQRHERTHTGEKPYKCALCSKAYAQSCDLLKHKKKHFGDKIYKCSDCEADFKFKSELRDHMSEHYLKDLSTNIGVTEVAAPERENTILRENV